MEMSGESALVKSGTYRYDCSEAQDGRKGSMVSKAMKATGKPKKRASFDAVPRVRLF